MASGEGVGTVVGLWRFPVKSMAGEQIAEAELTERGLVGDRRYALIDVQTGKVVSAKSVRLFPNVLGCQARFIEAPRAGQEMPPVRIVLPNGTSVTSDASDSDRVLSAYFGRDVTLARTAPRTSPSINTTPTSRVPTPRVTETLWSRPRSARRSSPTPVCRRPCRSGHFSTCSRCRC